MHCMACGERMGLVEAEPNTMFAIGFEHHTLKCVGCGESERRFVFRRSGEPLPEELWTPPTNERGAAQSKPAPVAVATVEQQPNGPALRAALSVLPRRSAEPRRPAEPPGPLKTGRLDIEKLRARLDDLRQRAELSKNRARAAERDEEERKRFAVFWDALATPLLRS